MSLKPEEASRLQDLALEVCLAFENVGMRCVITLDGHGAAYLACTGDTAAHAPEMLTNALAAAKARNARAAN